MLEIQFFHVTDFFIIIIITESVFASCKWRSADFDRNDLYMTPTAVQTWEK